MSADKHEKGSKKGSHHDEVVEVLEGVGALVFLGLALLFVLLIVAVLTHWGGTWM